MCNRTSGVPKIPTDAGSTRWIVRSAEDPTVEEMALNFPRPNCNDDNSRNTSNNRQDTRWQEETIYLHHPAVIRSYMENGKMPMNSLGPGYMVSMLIRNLVYRLSSVKGLGSGLYDADGILMSSYSVGLYSVWKITSARMVETDRASVSIGDSVDKRSKSGYRFGFVRFIKIKDVDMLVSNLCTIWVGRLKLHANIARFQRTGVHGHSNSFVQAVKMGHQSHTVVEDQKSALVLDDSCNLHMDLSLSVVGKIKEFASLLNIKNILAAEGFDDIDIRYKGGFWIRAKEVTGWTPDFNECKDDFTNSDNESSGVNNEETKNKAISDVDSEVEEIHETIFEQGVQGGIKSNAASKKLNEVLEEVHSSDPFNIYELLNKKNSATNETQQPEGEPKYPSRFTPRDVSEVNSNMEHNSTRKDFESNQNNHEKVNEPKIKKKASKLISKEEIEVLCVRDTLKVQIDGCINNFEEIVKNQGAQEWKGDVIVMGDFNEFRSQEERFGSIFNAQGADAFDNFISLGGLVEVSSGGLMRSCPNISAITLDRYLSDHKPIVLREISFDYGPIPFRFYHYWCQIDGHLKKEIRLWVKDNNNKNMNQKKSLKIMLAGIDSSLDKGDMPFDNLEKRMNIKHELKVLENMDSLELAQKSKIKWSIEGDENSKYFHGIINKQRSNLAIRGILVDGTWIEDPTSVKNEFLTHFKVRFNRPCSYRLILDMEFPNKLSKEQKDDLQRPFINEEIKGVVWDCGLNKSQARMALLLVFIEDTAKSDVMDAANHFFTHGFCPNRGNSSFIALIPKTQDAKWQILDGPFILNELIHWCKAKKKQTVIFKVDFEKAFYSVRWDFLDDVLKKFGFGDHWSQTGRPLIPFLFILVMESLHLSFQKVVNPGLRINMHKSKIMGVAVENSKVTDISQKDKNKAKQTKPSTGMERVQEIKAEGDVKRDQGCLNDGLRSRDMMEGFRTVLKG
ncbi:RNA-directed DNA polymerase, eukaryota [Tanacetum coccineum]